jgi:pyruvate dehydrogenase E2 component (dihydrolipoamide acetyltransferase)
MAAENGIDLRTVRGTGPGGRIVERDVQSMMSGTPAPAPVSPAPVHVPVPVIVPSGAEFTDKPLSLMRKTIAKRLVEAKSTIPHFYLTTDCDAGPLLEFRGYLNKFVAEEAKVSVNDVIVKATALALRKVPAVNASFQGDRIRTYHRVHVGVAVSVEDGLITPVVRDVDRKGLAQIAAETRDLATRARARKLTPEEMTGGTATVSNLGMYGIDHFEAIINPPEGVILAVGAARKQPVVDDKGAIVVGTRMALTLSCDHRVVDGALGARWLAELVKILEHPQALAL